MHVILFTDNPDHPKIKEFKKLLDDWIISTRGEGNSYKVDEGINCDFNIKTSADQQDAIKPFIKMMTDLTEFSPRKMTWEEWEGCSTQDKHPYHFVIIERQLPNFVYINFPTELLTKSSDPYEGYTKTADGFWTKADNWEKGKCFF